MSYPLSQPRIYIDHEQRTLLWADLYDTSFPSGYRKVEEVWVGWHNGFMTDELGEPMQVDSYYELEG